MENLILYQSPFPKKRIGRNHDGGYVTSVLPGDYDLFISGGISNDISFEIHLLSLYKELQCYAFDGTINTLPIQGLNLQNPEIGNIINRIHFVKKNLGNTNTPTLTNLHEYVGNYQNIFMKMDIEGHEFRVMPPFIEYNLMSKIKQLVVEIHSPGDIQLYPDYFNGLSDIKNEHMFALLNQINNTHTLIHFHANNGCKIQKIDGIDLPHVFELTYIRNDFVDEKIKNTETLPTSLDMKNIVNNPDYILKGFPYS